jgi:hypothetical protein
MSPEKRREMASKGGQAATRYGTRYKWDSEQAKKAGRKGGLASRGGRGFILDGHKEGQ